MDLAKLSALVGNGRFSTVWFYKRTNGELRRMRFRTGVKKHLKGVGASYSAADKGLLVVYDLERRAYRSVPADAVVELHANGRIYKAEEL